MNYVGLLAQEEKSILCEIITGRSFKDFFKKNENEFSKIRKGFRAKSLTEQQALSIAITNVDTPFIAMWINIKVDIWLNEIQNNIDKLEDDGLTYDFALATTLLDSVFADYVDLYLKLKGLAVDENDHSKLHERMEYIKSERLRNEESTCHIKALEEENRLLTGRIEEAQRNADAMREDYEQKLLKAEQEKTTLKSLLTESQEQIAKLLAAPVFTESGDADALALFDDTDVSVLPSVGSNEIFSLCGVISDYNGRKWLVRYADLNYNGYFNIFRKSEGAPPNFLNRDKIFYKDGPSNDGFYGIWTWSAIPNENDPAKDYVLSRYNMDLDAIEIVTVVEATNLDELVHLLKNGIAYQTHARKIMFSFYISKGRYMGILCSANELGAMNGSIMLTANCNVLPVYEFTNGDILRMDNGLLFYRNAFAGLPIKLYQVRSFLEITKDIVLSFLSWTAYKARGVTRTEYKTFKDFLHAIPVDDIICQIEAECRCTAPAAQMLLDEFLSVAWKYFDGSSLEDEIILSAISANVELQEKTKALIREDWETENSRLLEEAQLKLDSLDAELNAAINNLADAQEALVKTKSEDERLSSMIVEKEKLADDVEKAVAQKIQNARENAAEFIADMVFISGQQAQEDVVEPHVMFEAPSETVVIPYHIFPASEDTDDLEAHHTWTDVINTAAFELGEAGVVEQYRSGLAAFLCAAYIEKQPILLVGSNAIDIAQAFSAAVTGYKHGVLSCEGSFTNKVIAKIGADGENIVIINNLITGAWMNRLPEIISHKDIFYVVTHPYAEDIQVEPKSLYGFMLPLFTEFFVNKKATGKYCGGYFADDFEIYSAPKRTTKNIKVLSKLALNPLVRNQIDCLVAIMHDIYPATTTDDEFLFAVLPIAYALLSIGELTDAIADPQKGITISESLKHDLHYILGDI